MNCLDFSLSHDRPHLVSGGDDGHVKVWDYQTKQCLFTFDQGHTDNVSAVSFHPDLPIILSAGEDSVINIWNAVTFKLETFLNYGLQRVWAIHALPDSNYVAFGFDEATMVIKIGKEAPMASFNNGRVVWVRQSEIQSVNLKLTNDDCKDGEKLKPIVKDLGHSETFPQVIKFSPTGRYFAICGDSDFVVYQYPKFANSAFGAGNDLVWATVNLSQNIYAVKTDNGTVKVYKNFAEHKAFKTNFQNEGIFGGRLLAIKSKEFVTFYDWDHFSVVRRIDVSPAPKNVYWSENGELLVLALEDTFYLLRFNGAQTEMALRKMGVGDDNEEDGIEDAFTFVEEFNETVNSGVWISNECFVFVNNKGIINYLIGSKIMKLTNTDKKYFMLGYDAKQNRLYLIDKALNIVSYSLLVSVVNFQSAILNDDVHGAQQFFKEIPETFHSKLAKFLEANNQRELAFEITPDKDHKFDLALTLNKIEHAFAIAEDQESVDKWKKVGDIALMMGQFELAERCFQKSKDFNSLLLFYSSYGDAEGLQRVAAEAEEAGKYNVAYEAALLTGDAERCFEILLKANRVAEAAFFARAYAPSLLQKAMKPWSDMLQQKKLPF